MLWHLPGKAANRKLKFRIENHFLERLVCREAQLFALSSAIWAWLLKIRKFISALEE
jgi:hypothetical protein